MKYYFVAYEWTNKDESIKRVLNEVIKIHPVKWLIEYLDKYTGEGVALVFWQEVDQKIFKKFEGR